MNAKYEKIISLRQNNPCLTMAKIAKLVGLSDGRVWQILKMANLPTSHLVPEKNYVCKYCTKVFPSPYPKIYCSKECRHASSHVHVKCDVCGILIEKPMHQIRWRLAGKNKLQRQGQSLFFCTKKCYGKWLGNEKGFKKHPERQKLAVKKRLGSSKYKDLFPIIIGLQRKGHSLYSISNLLSIPKNTIYHPYFKTLLNTFQTNR